MNISELPYGSIERIQFCSGEPGNKIPDVFRVGIEVKCMVGADSRGWALGFDETYFSVVPVNRSEAGKVHAVMSSPLPTLFWIFHKDPQKGHIILQAHRFPKMISFPDALAIAVTDDNFKSIREKRGKGDECEILEWLSDQCFLGSPRLTETSEKGLQMAFLSEPDYSHGHPKGFPGLIASFRLLGKTIQANVTFREDTRRFELDKIIHTALRKNDGSSITFCTGDFKFVNSTSAEELRAVTRARMSSLLENPKGFLQLWEKFSEIESKIFLQKAREFDVIEYHSCTELAENQWEFSLKAPLSDSQLKFVADPGARFQAAEEVPFYIAEQDADIRAIIKDSGTREKGTKKQKVLRGEFRKGDAPSKIILEYKGPPGGSGKKPIQPPTKGYITFDIQSMMRQQERRLVAQQAIVSGGCGLPQLALLLEQLPFPVRTRGKHKGLSEKVVRKAFGGNKPTANQIEAIEVAINTPDIALIQGPPGTGKTTVINAILERLCELDEVELGAGNFLLSSYQHVAVDNALERIRVNGLVPFKFGGRQEEKDSDNTGRLLDEWVQERITNLNRRFPEIKPFAELQRLEDLVFGYGVSPGDAFATLNLIDEVLERLGNIAGDIQCDELREIRKEVQKDVLSASMFGSDESFHLPTIRAIRDTEKAFADDGPHTARAVISRLGSEILAPEQMQVLKKAQDWNSPDVFPWLKDLAQVKTALLKRFLLKKKPSPFSKPLPHLLAALQHALEKARQKMLASKKGPDAVSGEYLQTLSNFQADMKMALLDYSSIFMATCQQTDIGEIKKLRERLKPAGKKLLQTTNDNGTAPGRTDDPGLELNPDDRYDTVIIDEAARANPLDLFIPMVRARRRVILVGDHRQLPQLVDEETERILALELGQKEEYVGKIRESLFEWLFSALKKREKEDGIPRVVSLEEQYRMPPDLGDLIGKCFYEQDNIQIRSPRAPDQFSHDIPRFFNRETGKPVNSVWLEVPSSLGDEKKAGGQRPKKSICRPPEAKRIAQEIAAIIDLPETRNLTFGVITFYDSQREEIMRAMFSEGLAEQGEKQKIEICSQYQSRGRLQVGTVDSFQGREFDVVFLSMTRSNSGKNYGFITMPNRLCVALSRQKKVLVVAGNSDMVTGSNAQKQLRALYEFRRLCEGKNGTIIV